MRCRIHGFGWLATVAIFLAATAALGDSLVIDAGEDGAPAGFGFGWGRPERNNERSFVWIRHLEADLWVQIATPGAAEIEVLAAPYYVPDRRQKLGLFVNDRFVAEWTFAHREGWHFESLRAHIPKGYLKAGRNRITLRTSYTAWRGYAVAVDRVIFEFR